MRIPGSRRNLFLSIAATLSLLVLLIAACKPEKYGTDTSATSTTGSAPSSGSFHPVMWKDPGITGFAFPEPEDKINGWAAANDQKAMNTHAWGIWTGLTQETDQTFNNKKLLVFETWLDPQDVIAEGVTDAATAKKPRIPRRLTVPHQFFLHSDVDIPLGQSTVLGFVKYDPTAVAHIQKNNLLSTASLNTMLSNGSTAVPNFPNTAISLKPVFQNIANGQMVGGRYFQLDTWPGSPTLTQQGNMWVSKPFPQNEWGQCIWIDTQATGKGTGTGGVDTTCDPSGASRTDASTYGVGDFINFQFTAEEAAEANAEAAAAAAAQTPPAQPPPPVSAGDYSVLVAMHVTSRETTRWTWQTFWWLPNPNDPTAPSSKAIADDRPPQLTGAARNYAHCVAYSMEYPPQPNTGGKNVGESIYCFNPYLEAPFSPSVLVDSLPGETKNAAGKKVTTPNNVGAQTNCMSCHARANYTPPNVNGPNYSGDRYVDLDGPEFKGTLKVDFLWSIPGNAVPQPSASSTSTTSTTSTTTTGTAATTTTASQ